MTKETLIKEIHDVFPHAALGDGVSWEQSKIIDGYGTAEEEQEARRRDAHIAWPELIDDPKWSPFTGVGGFCFLDAKGFRHYLPPALVRLLRDGDTTIEDHLLVEDEKWAELTDPMKSVIARVLKFAKCEDHLKRYWGKYLR